MKITVLQYLNRIEFSLSQARRYLDSLRDLLERNGDEESGGENAVTLEYRSDILLNECEQFLNPREVHSVRNARKDKALLEVN